VAAFTGAETELQAQHTYCMTAIHSVRKHVFQLCFTVIELYN